jgi:hypothetical protein
MDAGAAVIRRAGLIASVFVLAALQTVIADDCLPVTGGSIEILAERWSLDLDQVTWLRIKLANGDLRDPSSLDDLPGTGPELRETLAESFCWSTPARVRVLAGVRFRENHDEERWSLAGEKEDWIVVGRLHRDASEDEFLKRGGARVVRGRWSLAMGTLENRQGLGLSVETPGTEPRGYVPRRRATASWTPAPVLDSGVLMGAALGCQPGRWNASLAAVRPLGNEHEGCLALGIGREIDSGGLACHITRARAADVVSVIAWGGTAAGSWGAEAARSHRGTAMGGTFGLALGSWKLRGSLVWTGAGFASPLVSGRDTPLSDGSATAALETRWSGGRGRFIRLLHAVDRRASALESTPVSAALADELEWAEPLRPGLAAAFLWRLRRSQPDGAPSSGDENQSGQAELRWTRDGFSARLRLEERLDVAGMSAWHVVAGRPRGRLSWEIRAGHARGQAAAAPLPIYFRRAGDWSGSNSVGNGTVVGVWLRARSGGWSVEMSGDGGETRWTWSVALGRSLGGRS